MDPALRLSKLQKLPPVLRRRTLVAVQSSEADDYLAIARNIHFEPDQTRLNFLPAVYSALDPANMDRLRQLGTTDTLSIKHLLVRVLVSIKTVNFMVNLAAPSLLIPTGAFIEIWGRVWDWIVLIDELWEQLPVDGLWQSFGIEDTSVESDADFLFYRDAVLLLWKLNVAEVIDPRLWRLLERANGAYTVLGHGWPVLLRGKDRDTEVLLRLPDALLNVGKPVRALEGDSEPDDRQIAGGNELLASVGGTDRYWALLTEHLNWICSAPKASFDSIDLAMLQNVKEMASQGLFDRLSRGSAYDDRTMGPLACAFLAVLRRLTAEAHPSQTKLQSTIVGLISVYLMLLRRILDLHGSGAHLLAAVEDGMMELLLLCASRGGGAQHTTDVLRTILGSHLLVATLDVSVLGPLHQHMQGIDPQDAERKLGNSELIDLWRKLTRMVEERFTMLGSKQRLRACDNVECCRIAERGSFKQCSECRDTIYCSRKCQEDDWRTWHRLDCEDIKRTRRVVGLSRRQMSFLRAVVHNAYDNVATSVAVGQLLDIQEGTNTTDVAVLNGLLLRRCTFLNLSSGEPRVETRSAPGWVEAELGQQSPEDGIFAKMLTEVFYTQVQRAVASNGKVELHFVCLRKENASGSMWLPMLLRRETPQRMEGLLEILARGPAEPDALEAQVKEVFAVAGAEAY
ncbi:MYND-type domain-containing protein [Mycena chlorophos]|uniref:MYND-type domain-containing protein n=1 Tax=Mycena chlorophos TaxID=658473 RepID=A0A8H6SJ09_MYCCL|nr:MYND-type domain-containing protein [Mycena chlorophos]